MKYRFVFPSLLFLGVLIFLFLLTKTSPFTALHILDIGQGDSILLRKGNVDILIDGGPDSSVIERLAEVRPPWDTVVDVLVLSHPQEDHMRGLLDVIVREHVRMVLLPRIPASSQTYRAFVAELRARHILVRAAYAGEHISIGDLHLEVLAPDATLLVQGEKNANNGAVVLHGIAPHLSFLLTADIERPTEQYLIAHAQDALASDILKVGHHGSKTSSSLSFLEAVHPLLSVISVGAKNRYGHPNPTVLTRYPLDRLLRTDKNGTVSITETADGFTVACQKGCVAMKGTDRLAPLRFFLPFL